ncbi:hypothetical protein EZV62_001219 [Acer yangbiense]|uniref:hAT-like transposase RNase-H fold domain-containing protein n=1 Tax=Acer yangbiense TaxID=1000413 RepID=A0A5C7ITF9_9ROSI|nr:hypothetical protein EZV62_001219 [Acer yangbiense]
MDHKKSDNTIITTTGVELVDATVPKPIPKLERPEPINLDDVVDATTNVDTPIDVDGPEHDDTKKRKLKSVVRNHFSKQKIKGLDKNKDIKQSILNPNKSTDGKISIGTYSYDQDYARHELANMIILHEYPLSMVEHRGFRMFVNSLQPLFSHVSKNTIKKDILGIYEVEKSKTQQVLEGNQGRIAITTDLWTASNQKRGYMTVTAHFIDDSWTLHSRIIRARLSAIETGIEAVRDSVAFWTTMPKRVEKFEEAARQLKVPCTKKLALDLKYSDGQDNMPMDLQVPSMEDVHEHDTIDPLAAYDLFVSSSTSSPLYSIKEETIKTDEDPSFVKYDA